MPENSDLLSSLVLKFPTSVLEPARLFRVLERLFQTSTEPLWATHGYLVSLACGFVRSKEFLLCLDEKNIAETMQVLLHLKVAQTQAFSSTMASMLSDLKARWEEARLYLRIIRTLIEAKGFEGLARRMLASTVQDALYHFAPESAPAYNEILKELPPLPMNSGYRPPENILATNWHVQ
eukprot:TRINITY_DN15582_c0_g1_i1.p1 TRINITY_DN15582_c0_g1~~TRINITY_DN15582_c0_g1_i1.p1  ORF type:complete len:179 (+),score=7.39 TRINITY_DN15582_c0_g1_i1:493-1029(+)